MEKDRSQNVAVRILCFKQVYLKKQIENILES